MSTTDPTIEVTKGWFTVKGFDVAVGRVTSGIVGQGDPVVIEGQRRVIRAILRDTTHGGEFQFAFDPLSTTSN